ncbi:MAG: hypothetical protein H0T07_00465 [Actinobacteria bacterium]|nr:hypothetical protein [Actinomycetota bacterium]
MSGARELPARGQVVFAAASVLILVAAMVLLDRTGARAPAPLAGGGEPSGAWLCPHGGASDLSVQLYLANPGPETVTARITRLGSEQAGPPESHEVEAGRTLRIDQVPPDRGAAIYVEYFGGWIGAGWVSSTEAGVAAEPCTADAARTWYLPDGTTQLGEEAFVIVANPFAAGAVMDVVIYTADQAPIRDSAWTDLVVPARRSISLHLNSRIKGEPVVAVVLEVSVGRVAASALGMGDGTQVRSTLGWTESATGATFPLMQGSGQTELILLSAAQRSIRFGATVLSEEQPRPAGGLTEQEHGPASAGAYAIPVDSGPAAIQLFTLEGAPVAGALRALGPGEDFGATAGAVTASDTWLVLPATSGVSPTPGAVVVNGGDADVVATVELLPPIEVTAAAPVTMQVPAHSAAAVPPEFWASAPGAALLIRTEGGAVVALAASTSRGTGDAQAFALSMGVALPRER